MQLLEAALAFFACAAACLVAYDLVPTLLDGLSFARPRVAEIEGVGGVLCALLCVYLLVRMR